MTPKIETRDAREARVYGIGGGSTKAVNLSGEFLLIPQGVEVKRISGEEPWEKREGLYWIRGGEYQITDLETGDKKVVKFSLF